MKFKELLEQLEIARNKKIILETKMEQCKCIVKSPSYGGIHGSASSNSVEDRLYAYADLETKYEHQLEEIALLVDKFEREINKLETSRERTILHLFYIEQICMPEIAVKIKYSYETVKRVRREAVKKLESM